MAREINLVPDIKGEMIKTLKLRNFIFFLCIVVSAASFGITAIVGIIMGGQQAALDGKENTIKTLSSTLASYSDLNDFLTIKSQLDNINDISSKKQVLSRTFSILTAMLPTGADTITISELSVELAAEAPTLFFQEAQANSGQAPNIDYAVLESFKKSMEYMRYDYGDYVDKNGNTIPAYCMIETSTDGATFNDPSRGRYAYWTIDVEGCDPSATSNDDSASTNATSLNTNVSSQYVTEYYNGQRVVRIWRTPQYNEWYKEKPVEGQPYMSLSGEISGVEHFESRCITYSGDNSKNSSRPEWTFSNDSCRLVPDGADGFVVTESSNGRSASDELVLRFSAVITINPEVYSFSNHHLIAVPPSGRINVTDSYVQVQAMFSAPARDCAEDDATCNAPVDQGTNTTNNSNSSSTNNSSTNSNSSNRSTNNSSTNSSERSR